MANETPTLALDLDTPVDSEDARARFALISALLEPLIDRTHGEVREELESLRHIAQKAAGKTGEA
jgi:iron-sulfur cluster repair protein YtfE (RIC family)